VESLVSATKVEVSGSVHEGKTWGNSL